MIPSYRAFLSNTRGIAAIEFALVVPVMIMAILGSYQVFVIARAKMLTISSARNLADLISQQDAVTTTEMADYCKAAQLSIDPLDSSSFAVSVASVKNSSSVRSIAWTDTTCGSVADIANALSLTSTVTPTAGDSAIVVSATYSLTLPITFPLSSSFTTTATAIARPRNGTSVTHD